MQTKNKHRMTKGKGKTNIRTTTNDFKVRHLSSNRTMLKGFDHPLKGFLSGHDLRCEQIMGANLGVALEGK